MIKARHPTTLAAFNKSRLHGSVPFSLLAARAAGAPAAVRAEHPAAGASRGPVAAGNHGQAQEPCCAHCQLPLGDFVKEGPNGKKLHAECSVELLLRASKIEEEAEEFAAAREKRARSAMYCIGWKPEAVTPNHRPAAAMGCSLLEGSAGLCSVVLRQSSNGEFFGRLAPCGDPAGSVNLEYLTLAMRSLGSDGRAPFFSLEAVRDDDGDASREGGFQAKTFEPHWLAGTSAGEVMFQADVYLKELSMGEHPQPVVGMRSCMDMCSSSGVAQDWTGREWFVIRKAELRIAEDGALLPHVVMGVEARQQLHRYDGRMEDVPLTRPDHPLLQYAADFSRYFDLIAERRSVVYHLRELARATVLATFLLENGVDLDVPELWRADARFEGPSQIPQLWRVRAHAELPPPKALGDEEAPVVQRHFLKVYGGVNLAFDAGQVIRPARGLKTERADPHRGSRAHAEPRPARPMRIEAQRLRPALHNTLPLVRLAQQLSHSIEDEASRSMGQHSRKTDLRRLPESTVTLMTRILKEAVFAFNIKPTDLIFPHAGEPKSRKEPEQPARRVDLPKPGAPKKSVGLRHHSAHLRHQALKFMKAQEGREVQLRKLLSETEAFRDSAAERQARGVDLQVEAGALPALGDLEPEVDSAIATRLFRCGRAFWNSLSRCDDMSPERDEKKFFQALYHHDLSDRRKEGELFVPPSSRRPGYLAKLREMLQEEADVKEQRLQHFMSASFSIEDPGPLFPSSWASRSGRQAGVGRRRGELYERPEYPKKRLDEILRNATLVFDRKGEDGLGFRVYRVCKLEIRTLQEPGASESPVGCFSSVPLPDTVRSQAGRIEDSEPLVNVTKYVYRQGEARHPQYFVVLETLAGHTLSEMMPRETAPRWLENYEFLEERLAGAKALRSVHCEGFGLQLGGAKAFYARSAKTFRCADPREVSRRYADGLYEAASPSRANEPGHR